MKVHLPIGSGEILRPFSAFENCGPIRPRWASLDLGNSAAKLGVPPELEEQRDNLRLSGGGGGIRTHETLSGLTVFKTAGVNRFPTPPNLSF
jgi:hypothetical protein